MRTKKNHFATHPLTGQKLDITFWSDHYCSTMRETEKEDQTIIWTPDDGCEINFINSFCCEMLSYVCFLFLSAAQSGSRKRSMDGYWFLVHVHSSSWDWFVGRMKGVIPNILNVSIFNENVQFHPKQSEEDARLAWLILWDNPRKLSKWKRIDNIDW